MLFYSEGEPRGGCFQIGGVCVNIWILEIIRKASKALRKLSELSFLIYCFLECN